MVMIADESASITVVALRIEAADHMFVLSR